jgi:hypothetical protein
MQITVCITSTHLHTYAHITHTQDPDQHIHLTRKMPWSRHHCMHVHAWISHRLTSVSLQIKLFTRVHFSAMSPISTQHVIALSQIHLCSAYVFVYVYNIHVCISSFRKYTWASHVYLSRCLLHICTAAMQTVRARATCKHAGVTCTCYL